ncbi:MAG: flagellar motor switch protein FliN [Beijerinckiaceae bacterium]
MMDNDLNLPDLNEMDNNSMSMGRGDQMVTRGPKAAVDLEQVLDVPVMVSAVLGKTRMEVSQLLKLAPGQLLELDRRVGEAIDIYVNNRLVARGEVVVVDEKLGVTMTEIIKTER